MKTNKMFYLPPQKVSRNVLDWKPNPTFFVFNNNETAVWNVSSCFSIFVSWSHYEAKKEKAFLFFNAIMIDFDFITDVFVSWGFSSC